jgi:hypothetical protein
VALAAAERAHQLLVAGTAIGDEPYADWADPAREQVRELLRRVRLTAAEAALATGDPRLTAGYAEAATAASSTRSVPRDARRTPSGWMA